MDDFLTSYSGTVAFSFVASAVILCVIVSVYQDWQFFHLKQRR